MTARLPAPAAGHTEWKPLPGSQTLFLACPHFECLLQGTRGPGKTIALLMDFAQHVGKGYGQAWRGVLFRNEYKELDDVIAKSRMLFKAIFPRRGDEPGARFLNSASQLKWVFPGGEELRFRAASAEGDYWKYHGHEIPWLGYDELCSWPDLGFYHAMKSVCRSSNTDMPRKVRAATNPMGPAHSAVKAYFIDAAPAGVPVRDDGGTMRVHLFSSLIENHHLMDADPDYVRRLMADPDQNRRKAWLQGSWDIVSGGALDDVWRSDVHAIPPFEVPASWRVNRSFDWGSSAPFAVIWWAESNGEDVRMADWTVRSFPAGTLFAIAEWYGASKANEGLRMIAAEIARGIVERERALGLRVAPGPADSAIYAVQNGNCIADDMARCGVRWVPANKGPGSRVNGLELLRRRLAAGLKRPMEDAGLFIFDTCRSGLSTLPVLPRDPRTPDDVDTAAEDHWYDAARYRVLEPVPQQVRIGVVDPWAA